MELINKNMRYTIEELKKLGAKPVSSETGMKKSYTLEELQKIGATPVIREVQPQQEGFLKTLAKGIVRPVATLAARPIQLARALGGATEEEQSLQLPFGLGKVETVRGARDVVKDIGRAAETVALGVGGALPQVGKGVFGATTMGRAIQIGGRAITTAPGAIPLTKGAFAVKQPISALAKQGAGIGLK